MIAPALTAWFEGPWTTAGTGVLAVAAQAFVGWRSGLLFSRNVIVQIIALAVLSALIVVMCAVRERRGRRLAQVRSVAEAAQHVLLWPLPNRLGTLRLACLCLAAEDEAEIGGDLHAAARTEGAVRLMIGDVRGKGRPRSAKPPSCPVWAGCDPEALLHHARRDLITHTGGRLGGDVTLIALNGAPTARSGHHLEETLTPSGPHRCPGSPSHRVGTRETPRGLTPQAPGSVICGQKNRPVRHLMTCAKADHCHAGTTVGDIPGCLPDPSGTA
ncbi:hypothetical protein [Streptomyces sasae]|uniref:hypothetical protein n=1 Tax=Streptomyces sasae TaxID=1266772 RepID=UPI00292FE12F|nr:hypothetical protein [Streptomyces sasae]